MLRRFGEFFAGAKTPHYDFDEVIVSADCILEFTGCMNEDSEEKEVSIFPINLNSSYCRPTKTFSCM